LFQQSNHTFRQTVEPSLLEPARVINGVLLGAGVKLKYTRLLESFARSSIGNQLQKVVWVLDYFLGQRECVHVLVEVKDADVFEQFLC
jgi:hypothetical protein